jgi:hypothetical protein
MEGLGDGGEREGGRGSRDEGGGRYQRRPPSSEEVALKGPNIVDGGPWVDSGWSGRENWRAWW